MVSDELMLRECTEARFMFTDLPIQPATDAQDKTTTFTHAFDVIKNVDHVDLTEVLKLVQGKDPLPSPFHFKDDMGTLEIQYIMVDEDDGSKTLIKHVYVGANRPRVLTSKMVEASVGEVFSLDISKFKARRLVPQTVQYLLHGLRGVGLFRKVLQTPELPKKELVSEAQVDLAFDHIEENAPLGSSNNEAMRWITKEKNNPESPIFSWPEGKIEKAIHNLQSAKSLAKSTPSTP